MQCSPLSDTATTSSDSYLIQHIYKTDYNNAVFNNPQVINNDTVGAVRVAGSSTARYKYLYDVQVLVPDLADRVCEFKCL